jgi:hypothetical protein
MTVRDSKQGIGMIEEESERRKAREREEIVARLINFKATQQRFEREREEYFFKTLANMPRQKPTAR